MASSHKRETARTKPKAALIAGPLAVLATGAAVTVGVLGAGPSNLVAVDTSGAAGSIAGAAGSSASSEAPVSRELPVVSRDELRPVVLTPAQKLVQPEAIAKAIAAADEELWTTEELNLWRSPAADAVQDGVIDAGKKVLVTGRSFAGRDEIVVDGESRWVTAGYLDDEKPVVGIGGECTNGTSLSPGVAPNLVKVHQAVCAAFPQITTYGDFRSDGEHSQGIAVDIMVSGELGWQIAEFIRANYSELGVNYLIYAQQIWSVDRAGEGWRGMEDRGSATANHYDHVHVTVY